MSAISNPTPVEALRHPSTPVSPVEPPRSAAWKKVLAALLVAGAALLSWQTWLKPKAPDPAVAALASIRTTKVTVGPLVKTLRVSGQTTSMEYNNITAPIMRGPDSGRAMILLSLTNSGSRVKKGQVLAQIDIQSMVDHVDEVKDDIERAQSDIDKRKAEQIIDIENLKQQIVANKAEYDKAVWNAKPTEVRTPIDQELLKLAVEEANARYKQSLSDVKYKEIVHKAEIRILDITMFRHRNHLARHDADIERCTIKSPMDGLAVVQANFRGGDWNLIQVGDQLGPGQLFMKVVNPDKMQVEGFLNQAETELFRIGQPATIRLDAFPGLRLSGKIYALGAMASGGFRQNNYIRNMPVRVRVENSDPHLIPDLSASMDVVVDRKENVKSVPLPAIFQDNGKSVVFVKSAGNKFTKRPVTVGMRTATHAEIDGVQAGEEIALTRPQGV
jgi:multidrug efflux pump subunit AcrA (membrane-fusion protein)